VERAVEASGVPFTFLRAAFFSQNLVRDITTHAVDIAKNNEILVPAGKGLTSFVDSRDVAEVAVRVMKEPAAHAGRAYVLTGPEKLDYHQVAAIMTEVLGRPIRYREPSMLRFWRTVGPRVSWDTLLFMSGVYFLTRTGKNAPMTDTLGRLLGRPPRTMRDFVADHAGRLTGEAATQWVKVKTPGLVKA
jgi:nucleoside-diphosphate-sugar epimerase